MKKLATLVREIRNRRGETQEKFAVRLGVRKSMVSRYEAGIVIPSRAVLLLLYALAESAPEKEAVTAALGDAPVEMSEREAAFMTLAKSATADLNAEIRKQGTSLATRENLRDLMVDAIGQKYVPLWLIEALKLWRRHRSEEDSEMDFIEAISTLDRKINARRDRE